jgi:MFS family permease
MAGDQAMARKYPERQTGWFYLELSAFWFALSFLWAGMITIVIQTLVASLAGPTKDLTLAWTLGFGALISTIVVIAAGAISDRSRWTMGRRRPYMIAGTLLSVPALLWLPSVRSIPSLIAAFCLIQFTVNVATSPYQALIPDLVPKSRQGTASAYMGMSSLLGQLGGLILSGTLIRRPGGLSEIVAVLASILVGTMVYTAARIPEQSATNNPAPALTLRRTLAESFSLKPRDHPDFYWLIASRFMVNMGFYTATEFLLYYVMDTLRAPRPVETVTAIFVISTFSGLLGNFPAGILGDRMPKKRIVYAAGGITALAALIFLVAGSVRVALGAAFFLGTGFGAFAAVDWALATNLLPERDEAKFMGVWHISFTVPQVIAPVIGGPVAYLFNHRVHAVFGQPTSPGFGYRVVLMLVIVYFAAGMALIRPVMERTTARPPAAEA